VLTSHIGLVYQLLNSHRSNLEKAIEITDITYRHSICEETLQHNEALHLAMYQVLHYLAINQGIIRR
jgi:hypothetical protein